MAQNPLAATVAVNTSNQQRPLRLDVDNNLRVTSLPALTALDITTATVLNTGAGRVGTIAPLSLGSVMGGIYDALTTAQINVTNQLCALSTTQLTVFKLDMPYKVGLVVAPGTGQSVSVNYE